MIGDIVLGTIALIGTAVFTKLPDVTTNSAFVDAVSTASGYISGMSMIVPTGTILLILGFSLFFEGGYLTFKVIYWVIRRFPTQS